MGTTIDAVTVAGGRDNRTGALQLTDDAARACLTAAGIAAGDLDLLINCGIYHDRNMEEPALAALIQEDIGANPGHPPVGGHGTFSFDLANGPCGVLNAMDVIDGFLRTGTARRGLVVAGDAHPGRGLAVDFPFSPAAGAAVLGWDDAVPGLVAVRTETHPEYEDLFGSHVSWEGGRRGLLRRSGGSNVLTVEERPEYRARAAACAAETVPRFLADHHVEPGDVDLVVTNGVDVFADHAALVGIPGERFIPPDGEYERAHTAGLLAAMHGARADGRWDDAGTALLVAYGAGITIGCALYRNR